MSERVQGLGGNLLIDSQPGKGTRLLVELALDQEVNHAGAKVNFPSGGPSSGG